ncbi:MAG: HD domain-containing protein [Sedimenticola sp.]|nr:HD domain-containing protein [Sedimenticola sp.]
MSNAVTRVNLIDMVLCFSRALDLLHPSILDHHLRVAYIAACLAQEIGLDDHQVQEVLIAGALHDIGTVSSTQMLALLDHAMDNYRLPADTLLPDIHRHGEEGYHLIRDFPPFSAAAEAIRFHHVNWEQGRGEQFHGLAVPVASHILHLADRVAVLPEAREHILLQRDRIRRTVSGDSGHRFMPRLVQAFESLSDRESFWLDLVYPDKGPLIRQHFGRGEVILDLDALHRLGGLFGRIIDYRSPFTATHSSGVAATAGALGELLGMSAAECGLLRVAGDLHDIGKLAVPLEIIDKPDALTREEMQLVRQHAYYTHRILSTVPGLETVNTWASLHHERLDGRGYPFRTRDIPVGARIVAVADIFTAITEDRPYRRGMTADAAKRILQQQVHEGAIDGDVVKQLILEFEQLLEVRHHSQHPGRRVPLSA